MTLDLTSKKPAQSGLRLSADLRDAYTLIETAVNDALADIATKADAVTVAAAMPVGTGPLPCMQAAPPTGFIFFDGGTYSRVTYAALIAWALAQNLVGTGKPFGVGDGTTTFTTADLGGKGPMGYKSTDTDFNAIGKTGGEKTHALSTAELAAHAHGVSDPGHSHTEVFGDGSGGASFYPSITTGGNGGSPYGYGDVAGAYTGISIQNSGSGTAHNNLQPYFTVNWMVKT